MMGSCFIKFILLNEERKTNAKLTYHYNQNKENILN
jgi:hypothetical protein